MLKTTEAAPSITHEAPKNRRKVLGTRKMIIVAHGSGCGLSPPAYHGVDLHTPLSNQDKPPTSLRQDKTGDTAGAQNISLR